MFRLSFITTSKEMEIKFPSKKWSWIPGISMTLTTRIIRTYRPKKPILLSVIQSQNWFNLFLWMVSVVLLDVIKIKAVLPLLLLSFQTMIQIKMFTPISPKHLLLMTMIKISFIDHLHLRQRHPHRIWLWVPKINLHERVIQYLIHQRHRPLFDFPCKSPLGSFMFSGLSVKSNLLFD